MCRRLNEKIRKPRGEKKRTQGGRSSGRLTVRRPERKKRVIRSNRESG